MNDKELAAALRDLATDEEVETYKYVEESVNREDLICQERAEHYSLFQAPGMRYLFSWCSPAIQE